MVVNSASSVKKKTPFCTRFKLLLGKCWHHFSFRPNLQTRFSNWKLICKLLTSASVINPLTPNDHYSGRTAPLTSKRCILYIYFKNIGNEYFKHGIYCPFFPLQNAVCFIIPTYLVPVLFPFCIQDVLKFKKIIPAPKG